MEELIKKENIIVGVDASDWKDSIHKAGDLLIKSGDITKDYIVNMIKSVEELGPYIVLTKGFALAHSAPDDSVINTSISLITLNEPVDFGSHNDPVKIVMVLACKDREAHMSYLQKVAMILMKQGTIDKLMNSNSIDEIYQIINDKEEL